VASKDERGDPVDQRVSRTKPSIDEQDIDD
jgi:hypothetical protein